MGKARIFVADDDTSFLSLMQDVLEEDGYSVTLLHAANTAYEEILENLPDLLILDIVLEHSNAGWGVLNKVKLNPKTTNMPVIVCSALGPGTLNRQDYLESKGCLILNKPFDLDDLLAVVNQALHTAPPSPGSA